METKQIATPKSTPVDDQLERREFIRMGVISTISFCGYAAMKATSHHKSLTTEQRDHLKNLCEQKLDWYCVKCDGKESFRATSEAGDIILISSWEKRGEKIVELELSGPNHSLHLLCASRKMSWKDRETLDRLMEQARSAVALS